jgi:mono/diheme cytochrome c family protein
MQTVQPDFRAHRFVVKMAAGLLLGLALDPPCLSQTTQTDASPNAGVKKLFERFCQGCHGMNGKGDSGVSGIPDFTRRAWHEQKADATLIVSILEGKGSGMPAFGDKLSRPQAKQLMMHIRSLAPKPAVKESEVDVSHSEFAKDFKKLQGEYQDFRKQLLELTKQNRGSRRDPGASETVGNSQKKGESFCAAKLMYRDRCQKCHGADGKGVRGKLDCAEPPDFTRREWQEQRSDAQLIKSISEGKESGMPAFGKHLSEDQVRDLVEYVRSLTPPRRATPPNPADNPGDKSSGKKEGIPAPGQPP